MTNYTGKSDKKTSGDTIKQMNTNNDNENHDLWDLNDNDLSFAHDGDDSESDSMNVSGEDGSLM